MRTIGLLGGSFDPLHTAHLAMADAFAVALRLDEIRFVPASQPWQKHGLFASGEEREAMLEAALAHHRAPHGHYVIDTRELRRAGKTYTIATLEELRREVGAAVSLIFLFGADQLVHLDTWKDWRRLWDHAHLAAATRPGFDVLSMSAEVAREWSSRLGDVEALHTRPSGRSYLLDDFAHDVSATDIRATLGAGDASAIAALSRLVPSAVLDYIRANHLYRS
ncbi:MAG: nicotinate-nucleotide adenylyltransferase [Burkholderiaceae bacterium]